MMVRPHLLTNERNLSLGGQCCEMPNAQIGQVLKGIQLTDRPVTFTSHAKAG